MSKYERIRREIIAMERDIAILQCCVKTPDDKKTLDSIREKRQQIQDSFATVDYPETVSA